METINEIRAALGLSQSAFGDLLGVSQARVSEWENGRKTPNRRTMIAARYLLEKERAAGDKSEAA